MKTITIISSPKTSTEYEIKKEISPWSRDGEVYFITEEGLQHCRTEAQSQARIKELEEQLFEMSRKLDAIEDILNPDRYEEYDDET